MERKPLTQYLSSAIAVYFGTVFGFPGPDLRYDEMRYSEDLGRISLLRKLALLQFGRHKQVFIVSSLADTTSIRRRIVMHADESKCGGKSRSRLQPMYTGSAKRSAQPTRTLLTRSVPNYGHFLTVRTLRFSSWFAFAASLLRGRERLSAM